MGYWGPTQTNLIDKINQAMIWVIWFVYILYFKVFTLYFKIYFDNINLLALKKSTGYTVEPVNQDTWKCVHLHNPHT